MVATRAEFSINKFVRIWLIIGLIMILFQIVIGGITRLTGSGLSITEWDIVTGTIPPLNLESWLSEFEKYKETPQYRKLNMGMELGSIWTPGTFKFIYFWEYLHRLWARTMGFVFLLPFLFFYFKKILPKRLLKHLAIVILLSVLAATFGWIMVASGLIQRPWVNAYKLSIHLCIGISVFIALWWAYLNYVHHLEPKTTLSKSHSRLIYTILVILVIQIFLGGVMSGTKAALFYNTWPDYQGEIVPSVIFQGEQWNSNNFNNYEQSNFLVALVQFLHRTVAYILLVISFFVLFKSKLRTTAYTTFFCLLIVQAILGVLTLLYSKGVIPVYLGVLHQAFAVFTLSALIAHIYFGIRKPETQRIV